MTVDSWSTRQVVVQDWRSNYCVRFLRIPLKPRPSRRLYRPASYVAREGIPSGGPGQRSLPVDDRGPAGTDGRVACDRATVRWLNVEGSTTTGRRLQPGRDRLRMCCVIRYTGTFLADLWVAVQVHGRRLHRSSSSSSLQRLRAQHPRTPSLYFRRKHCQHTRDLDPLRQSLAR